MINNLSFYNKIQKQKQKYTLDTILKITFRAMKF